MEAQSQSQPNNEISIVPLWMGIGANALVLAIFGVFVWGWFANIGDAFILVGPLGFLGLGFAVVVGLVALSMTLSGLDRARSGGEKTLQRVQKGALVLSLLPLVLVVLGLLLVRKTLGLF